MLKAPRPKVAQRATTQTSAIPARVTLTQNFRTGDETVVASERCNIVVLSETADNSEPASIIVEPFQSMLWPKLAQKAALYTEYDCAGIRFEYTPAVGSNYNGSVALGFTPQPQFEGADGLGSQSVIGLPVSVSGSVGTPSYIEVSPSNMANKGKGMFLAGAGINVEDQTRYYLGRLWWITYDCDAAGGSCGTITATYKFVLRRTKLDTNATSTYIPYVGTIHPGEVRPTVTTLAQQHLVFRYASVRPHWLVLRSYETTGLSFTIHINGEDVSEDAGFHGNTDAKQALHFFSLGRRSGETEIDVTYTTGNFVSARLVSANVAMA